MCNLVFSSWIFKDFAVCEGMPSFVYITDVFCPWCYGFAPVMQKLRASYALPVRVLCGNLVDEPRWTSSMGAPRVRAFFQRLASTTGRAVGEHFFDILTPERSVVMDSSRSALLMAALRKLAPGHALEQMETFQDAFYGEGRDVLSLAVQAELCRRWGVKSESLESVTADPAMQKNAVREMAEVEEILGDFVVYPSLFVKNGDSLYAVARGYSPYETVAALIDRTLSGFGAESQISGQACGLDGEGCCGQDLKEGSC